jgi:hypothetical protein
VLCLAVAVSSLQFVIMSFAGLSFKVQPKQKPKATNDAWLNSLLNSNTENNNKAAAKLPIKATEVEEEEKINPETNNPTKYEYIDHDEFISQFTRELNELSSANIDQPLNKSLLITKLNNLNNLLQNNTNDSSNKRIVSNDSLQEAIISCLKPVLKLFANPAENVRSLAIDLIINNLNRLVDSSHNSSDNTGNGNKNSSNNYINSLQYTLPVLNYRLSKTEPPAAQFIESSEELREKLFQLINQIVTNCVQFDEASSSAHKLPPPSSVIAEVAPTAPNPSSAPSRPIIEPYLSSILQLCCVGLEDPAPAIKFTASSLVNCLARRYRPILRAVGPILLRLVMPNLLHKLSKIKIISIEAMENLMFCGCSEQIRDLAAFRESNLIEINAFYHGEARVNYFAELVGDSNPKVRFSFYSALGNWLSTLLERADYETLLFPYLLSGLGDSEGPIQALVAGKITELGAQYERDHRENYEEYCNYGLAAEKLSRKSIIQCKILLFPPFEQRPGWGERQLARKFFDRLLGAIINELNDWKVAVQTKSFQLLRNLLIYAEEHVTTHAPALIRAFFSTIHSQNHWNLIPECANCIELMGRYCDSTVLMKNQLIPAIITENQQGNGGERQLEALIFCSIALEALPLIQNNPAVDSVGQLLNYFAHSDDFSNHFSVPVALAVLSVINSLLRRAPEIPKLAQISPQSVQMTAWKAILRLNQWLNTPAVQLRVKNNAIMANLYRVFREKLKISVQLLGGGKEEKQGEEAEQRLQELGTYFKWNEAQNGNVAVAE